MAQRIRLSRAKGWRLPPGAVSVARPGKWGNPFVVGRDGTRAQCAALFLQLCRGFIDLGGRVEVDAQRAVHRRVRRELAGLAGKDLACWCKLDGGACHGDVLLILANPGLPVPAWLAPPGVELPRVRLGIDARELDRLDRAKARASAAKRSEAG